MVTALGLVGFLCCGVPVQLFSIPWGLWWTELFVFFGVAYVALHLSGRAPFPSAGFTRPWAAGCAFGFALGSANFFAAVAPLQFISQWVAPKWLVEAYDSSKIFADKSAFEVGLIVAGVCIAAPLAEEFFFRGLLQRGWASVMPPVFTIVLTGAVFSAFHGDPVGFAARWELGILFGLLYWRSGSLWPGVFAHLGNNLTTTSLYFAFKDAPQDPTEDVTAVLAIAGIGGLALLAVLLLGRRYPGVLQSPAPARETLVPAASPRLVATWALVAVLAVVALVAIDLRGSLVNAIDTGFAVKNPTKELKAKREAARKGELALMEYFEARREAAVARRDAGR
jgi:hypothetical protein